MKLTIDNRQIEVKKDMTLLDAARANDIYIPHICAHPELTPYGGCRLCIVEVEGMRGYPTACTAKVKDGMNVTTNTDAIRDMRREILQLILSEHPSGCLVCRETEACADNMHSIRKVGAVTGCRWCPEDGACELQRVVQHLEIDTIKFPVYYQDLDVEKYDPFFDRDYNLCIYCGRCVRICEEHRKSFVLGLNERGKDAVVGPAFHNSHIQAECEFCGSCVSVCPTGALSEKSRKWNGVPTGTHDSFCPFCSMNCDTQILTRKGRVMGTQPPGETHESGGQHCVKGRFCLGETVNHPDRLLEPRFRFFEGYGIISPEDAVAKAAEHIKTVKGKRAAMYLSPNLPLEELAAARRFAQDVLGADLITSSILNENFVAFHALTQASIPLPELENADAVVSIGLRGNYHFAPLTLAVKRLAEKGAPFCKIGWTRDTTSRFAALDMSPPPGKEKLFFRKILSAFEKGKGGSADIKKLVSLVKDAASPVFIVGPGLADLTEGKDILHSIETAARLAGAGIFAPNPYGNLTGFMSMIPVRLSEEVNRLVAEKHIDLLYIVGDAPFENRPPVDFIIHQSSFPPAEALQADLMIPAATWSEISGTYADSRGKRKKFKAAVEPPGYCRTNIETFAAIAKALGRNGVSFSQKAIAGMIPKKLTVDTIGLKSNSNKRPKVALPDAFYPQMLLQERVPHAFHNLSLSRLVAGMRVLLPEETLVMHPADAQKLGLKENDDVSVESGEISKTYPLKLHNGKTPGIVYLYSHSPTAVFNVNPCPVHLRRNHV